MADRTELGLASLLEDHIAEQRKGLVEDTLDDIDYNTWLEMQDAML